LSFINYFESFYAQIKVSRMQRFRSFRAATSVRTTSTTAINQFHATHRITTHT
jgi:hypothetical protein